MTEKQESDIHQYDLLPIFDNFIKDVISMGMEEDEAHDHGSDLFRSLEMSASAYGTINGVISVTSAWEPSLQKLLFKQYLHDILIDIYVVKIKEDPKKMLYVLSEYTLRFSNLYLSELLAPVRDYARDIVMLNQGDGKKIYIPSFSDDDLKNEKKSSENMLDDLRLDDILTKKIVPKCGIILNRLKELKNKQAELIAAFYSLFDIGAIDEEYKVPARSSVAVGRFLTKILERETPVDKNTVTLHRDKNSNAEARRKKQGQEFIKLLMDPE